MTPVRVLVVDDSATMRALLRRSIDGADGIEVVGEASNPLDAREKIKQLDPDVITLDIEMPNMNGLEFLSKIMRLRPTPVIMVSNLTQPGAAATLTALEIGAFDCISKPNGAQGNTFETLPPMIREAAKSKRQLATRVAPKAPSPSAVEARPSVARHGGWPDIIGVGSSTGGVEALMNLLSGFPADCPPTLIVQHLPAAFTGSFAARLNRICKAEVAEAQNGEAIAPGRVYLAPGGKHLAVKGRAGVGLRCILTDEDTVQGHRPSVDVLFHSISAAGIRNMTGVILTGMGRDGADGLLAMRRQGARTMAQDEATSLVYGMPRVAFEIGAAERRVPLGRIAEQIFA
ncbi:chemotaxis response regulator protein-glutamate methylesterase of group 1 operon [Aureimonas endophytica]|uniref:Protein-glutamate methylesterase/protein-glutamine glutaminase n=1 Tax=Aureimonas endophytica TaxID=2027858 RepID=A0A916ZYE6_9HYPH|nr:chemotaxis response regulator protein-glutamate methylesterase [Aureimonas endophytica]GGE17891.1 chemotaxis response regulator protein-glutamate methylesterase of group 1 operon [Aureimonas endophytica]